MAGPIKPNDPNRRNNDPNGGGDDKRRSPWGFMSIVMWAIMLVFLLHMCSSSVQNASVRSVPFSTFYEWVEAGYVDSVELSSNVYTFTLKEDAPPLKEYQNQQKNPYGFGGWGLLFGSDADRTSDSSIKFQTAPISRDLANWLDRNGVSLYETKMVTDADYMISAIVSYVLPIVFMVVVMLLIYRYIFKKMGSCGIGGIGGVGKSNAKVYVEK